MYFRVSEKYFVKQIMIRETVFGHISNESIEKAKNTADYFQMHCNNLCFEIFCMPRLQKIELLDQKFTMFKTCSKILSKNDPHRVFMKLLFLKLDN